MSTSVLHTPHMHTCIHAHTHAYMQKQAHTHMHMYIHAHTCIQKSHWKPDVMLCAAIPALRRQKHKDFEVKVSPKLHREILSWRMLTVCGCDKPLTKGD